ncbi:MAG: hypothetical protein KAI83_11885 [Thiomargarita sp.]|nr:hypothetical protein [Thiomargarita sp.]
MIEFNRFKKWIGAGQRTCKKGFPACPLPTAPGCNALAALRLLSLPTRAQLPQWLYADFRKLWLPETTRHRCQWGM